MTSSDWAAVAAIAAGFSAVFSAVSAFYSRKAIAREVNDSDCNSCMTIIQDLAEAERRVRDATPDHREFEFRSLFNLMEALASLVNDGRIPRTTLKIVESYLKEAWAWLREDREMVKLMATSVTGADTYIELQKFAEANQLNIRGLSELYRDRRPN